MLTSCSPVGEKNNSAQAQSNLSEWSCIRTFDDFLYQMVRISRDDERYNQPAVYPSSPWELSAEIPEAIFNDARANIELARIYAGQTELWIRAGGSMIKHIVGTDNFAIVSTAPYNEKGNVYGTVQVRDLFEIATGQILGVNYPENYNTVWLEEIPLFSVYNEAESKFEFYEIGLKYRDQQVSYGFVGMIPCDGVIIARSDKIIWIYQQQDGFKMG